ncbi:MAG: ferritin family protein [Alphaproteobacteria bacterium]|nr:ferritin family protein [Alphaproteobacteria bacterium]
MTVKPPQLNSVAEFFAQALAIETEASERYGLLADQMEVHNNREITAIFRKMANIEAKHRDEIRRRAGDALVEGRPASFTWLGPDGPEAIDLEAVHYLMTPYRALMLARYNEERAAKYFEAIAQATTDPEIAVFAAELARDEHEHVAWVDKWLEQYPAEDNAEEDPDPPVYSE